MKQVAILSEEKKRKGGKCSRSAIPIPIPATRIVVLGPIAAMIVFTRTKRVRISHIQLNEKSKYKYCTKESNQS